MGRIAAIACVIGLGCGRLDFDTVAPLSTTARPVAIAYPTQNVVALLNNTLVSLTPTTTGNQLAFAIAPALPTGLMFDTATGAIAGVPAQLTDDVAYTITASNAYGRASTTLTVTALPGFLVDVVDDGGDDNMGLDANCFCTPVTGCTLRAAVQTANRQLGKQLILMPAGTYIVSGSALEAIQNDIEIAGAGRASTDVRPIMAQPGHNMISVATAHHLWLKNAAFSDFGKVDGPVVNMTAGALDASECTFDNNASAGSGGVLFITGGATATFERCVFLGNMSFGGNGWGGVIDGEGPNTTISVYDSFAAQNQTDWGSFAHITTGTTLLLQNSTLVSNTSHISGTLASPGGTYTLVNDSIVMNTNVYATPDDSTTASAGIYLFAAPAHYTLTNTLLAGNTDVSGIERNCNRRDLTTSLTSNGGNLFSDDGRNCASYFSTTDRFMTDPGIDALGDHGGMTPTLTLAPGSAALDTGMLDSCPSTDQRGLSRPIGAGCDVGAVEMP